jgi:hypothetical protein
VVAVVANRAFVGIDFELAWDSLSGSFLLFVLVVDVLAALSFGGTSSASGGSLLSTSPRLIGFYVSLGLARTLPAALSSLGFSIGFSEATLTFLLALAFLLRLALLALLSALSLLAALLTLLAVTALFLLTRSFSC